MERRDIPTNCLWKESGAKPSQQVSLFYWEKIVLRRTFSYLGETVVSELMFENVSAEGFYWSSKYITNGEEFVNWTSDCKRLVSPQIGYLFGAISVSTRQSG